MLGDNVFYVQESIAGDPNRVLGQKIVMFGVVKGKIVQTDFALNEPHRWRNGQNNPDLFKGIMTQDVRSIKGCSLRWKRAESGNFEGDQRGQDVPQPCRRRAASLRSSSKPSWARRNTRPRSRPSTSPATRPGAQPGRPVLPLPQTIARR